MQNGQSVLTGHAADDLADVVGLRSTDRLLFIGGCSFSARMRALVHESYVARKRGEIVALLGDGRRFDRVVVSRDGAIDPALIAHAAELTAPQGLLCLVSNDQGSCAEFSAAVEAGWPRAEVWECSSTAGQVVITTAAGIPEDAR